MKVDILVIILAIFAVFRGARQGAALGFTYGLIEDLYLAKYVGLNALSKMFIGYLIGLNKDRLNTDNWIVPGILVFIASIGQGFFVLVFGKVAGMNYPLLWGTVHIILPMAFYNTGLAILGYSLYQGGVAWAARRRKIGS